MILNVNNPKHIGFHVYDWTGVLLPAVYRFNTKTCEVSFYWVNPGTQRDSSNTIRMHQHHVVTEKVHNDKYDARADIFKPVPKRITTVLRGAYALDPDGKRIE